MADEAPGGATAWRAVLGRRLTALTLFFALLTVAVLAAGLGTDRGRGWWILSPVAPAVVLTLLMRRSTDRARAIAVVAVVLSAAALGYTRFGPSPGPALAVALAVVIAGLLLGRRAMWFVLVLSMAVATAVGALMVRGDLAAPAAREGSPALAEVWIRTGIFTVFLVCVLAAVVTWVIEQVEVAAARAEREIGLRREAERKGLEAQQAELVGQVAAGLAHDINNHLAVISMWSSVLLSAREQDDLEEASDEITCAIEQATALTRRVLVLGRRGVHTPRPMSLTALVSEHAGTLRRILGAGIALELAAPTEEAWCHADEAQLNQVLLNLAMNARDALPDGGTVTVRTGRRPHGGTEPAFLEVEDTGAGMSEEVRRRAAEPFFTTKQPGKGSGLGLAAVAAVARQNGGDLVLESTPGKGTRAAILLPAIAAPPRARPVSTAPPPRVAVRVLLVDDSPALVQVARRTLQEAGCTVVVAADGDEALQRIGEARFELLCSDVVMPGRPLREVIAEFEARNPGAPVLLCSGYVGEELVRRGIEAGRYRFLAKPYGPAQLVAEVASLVRDPAARGAGPGHVSTAGVDSRA